MVRVENGIITQEVNILVQPPDNYYWSLCTDIHRITEKDTLNSPSFAQVWHQIVPYIDNQNVVAHNGFGFDFPVLNATLNYYNLPTPDYNKFCIYKICTSNLAIVCEEHNIQINHHDALSDAQVCAELYLFYRNKKENYETYETSKF